MKFAEVQDARERVGEALVRNAPDGWSRLQVSFTQVGRAAQMDPEVVWQDGSRTRSTGDMRLSRAFKDLRRAMYDPRHGAWFTATAIIDRELRLSMAFDYDGEPMWNLDIITLSYAEDLRVFPRPEETWPDWLRHKMRETAL